MNLITHSNLYIFEGVNNKFKCLLCKANFRNITFLRDHFRKEHKQIDFKNKVFSQKKMSYFQTDITDLKCTNCGQSCSHLEELKNHLVANHDVKFHSTNSMLVPFRFTDNKDIFRCVVCDEKFDNLSKLSRHMSMHFGKFVCDTCGASFYNYKRLKSHITSNHKSPTCVTCKLSFSTAAEKYKHRQKVHKIMQIRYCSYCREKFGSSYKMLLHMIQIHGQEKPEFPCEYCGKIYLMKSFRTNHVKTVHQGLRTKSCQICSMQFYRNYDLRRHQLTHDLARNFSCAVCNAKFKTKDSLNRHVKTRCYRGSEIVREVLG